MFGFNKDIGDIRTVGNGENNIYSPGSAEVTWYGAGGGSGYGCSNSDSDSKDIPIESLTEVRKKELIARFEAMTDEEKRLLLEVVPIEFCLDRIRNELDRVQKLKDSVMATVRYLK